MANLKAVAVKQVNTSRKISKNKNIKVNDLVMLYTPIIKRGLSKKFVKCNSGPYRVLRKLGPVNYVINSVKNGNAQHVHVDRVTKILEKPTFQAWLQGPTY